MYKLPEFCRKFEIQAIFSPSAVEYFSFKLLVLSSNQGHIQSLQPAKLQRLARSILCSNCHRFLTTTSWRLGEIDGATKSLLRCPQSHLLKCGGAYSSQQTLCLLACYYKGQSYYVSKAFMSSITLESSEQFVLLPSMLSSPVACKRRSIIVKTRAEGLTKNRHISLLLVYYSITAKHI